MHPEFSSQALVVSVRAAVCQTGLPSAPAPWARLDFGAPPEHRCSASTVLGEGAVDPDPVVPWVEAGCHGHKQKSIAQVAKSEVLLHKLAKSELSAREPAGLFCSVLATSTAQSVKSPLILPKNNLFLCIYIHKYIYSVCSNKILELLWFPINLD